MAVFEGTTTPVVVGHRGLRSSRLDENSPAAFAAAHAAGARWVELDVRRSADAALVVHHDARTADGVPIVDRTAAALAEHGVRTLDEVLAGLPTGLGVDVEVKNLPGEPDYDPADAIAGPVCDVVAAHRGGRPFLLSSFNPLTVAAMSGHPGGSPVGLIHFDSLSVTDAIQIAREHGAVAVCSRIGSRGLDVDGVAAVHEAGMEIMVWTVNDPAAAQGLARAGVEALCTDEPATIVAALSADTRQGGAGTAGS